MSSKKPKMSVVEYSMSVHFGVCSGPVDSVKAIYIGEKKAWEGNQTTSGVISVDKHDLFGGIKKEGGIKGDIAVLLGTSTQVIPNALSSLFGRQPVEMPAYRGITSLFFKQKIDWDGTFDNLVNRVVIPAGGLTVNAGTSVVGFTVNFTVPDTSGATVSKEGLVPPEQYPEYTPQVGLGINVSGPPPSLNDYLAGAIANNTAYLSLAHEFNEYTDHIRLGALYSNMIVRGGSGTFNVDTDLQPAGADTFYCTFDGATGVFTIYRTDGSSVSQTLSTGQFTLFLFDSRNDVVRTDASVESDVTNPIFPVGVIPIGDVL